MKLRLNKTYHGDVVAVQAGRIFRKNSITEVEALSFEEEQYLNQHILVQDEEFKPDIDVSSLEPKIGNKKGQTYSNVVDKETLGETSDSIVEKPKVEKSKVEEPKVEKPKVEKPKVEEPKVEEPKVEEPKVEVPNFS